ncbi:epoxide hydrolase 3 [Nicotiana tabacum]|uniref:soluble epoxide hydrolase n=2 Tax=Nicotiana TaxID=4085 RepID=A0A1S3WY84_TOBAC|nr:PREDICTED: bifunctional epoxide hydrolase 2-like [Nicotiana sylvestris]XP_016432577.1 PREDICTED: bifunctional epoxide hydrolase 2-like [Nicotiana tabacum]
MEGIEHRTVNVNGINMHVAEKGQGPVVLFLHGFPELWYTWRHQLVAFADLGYRAVAPDLRGYGDTDAPAEAASYTCFHVVGDLVALIESLGVESVFLVAHDWGAMIGWYLCLFRPDLVKAYVCLSVPFRPRHPKMKPIPTMRAFFGDDYYMCRFQDPGMEDEIAKYGSEAVLKKILTDRKPGPPCLPKENPFGISPDSKLPSWLSQDDLKYYSTKFDQKGFTGGLNYYRALDLNWELTAAWTGAKVKVPVKFMVGELDLVYTTPGMKEYVHGGGFKKDVPMLDEDVVVMEGAAHFINQERAQDTNSHIHGFINKF